MKAALPFSGGRGFGCIINLSSVASDRGVPERFAYSMSKGAVSAMTRSVAVDYLPYGVRCNCIAPARIHTPFVDGYLERHYPGREAEMFDRLSGHSRSAEWEIQRKWPHWCTICIRRRKVRYRGDPAPGRRLSDREPLT